MSLIAINNLHKTYRLGRVAVPVLRGVNLAVEEGEWVAVLGASGSGKSTLLHLMGGLDRADATGNGKANGSIVFDGRPLSSMSVAALDAYRAADVGFVFQFYHLLPELSVVENVLIGAMVLHGRLAYGRRKADLQSRARELLESFGLSHRLKHRPAELSGGERQRVAIARALINRPRVLLADEPTGNLDRATGEKIIDSIARLRDGQAGGAGGSGGRAGAGARQTIVMVTHDPAVAARATRIVHLEDGRVAEKP
jgi:ABC-type lipoprotein export system ATPase subunit